MLVFNPYSTINLGFANWITGDNNLFGGINLKKGNRAFAFAVYSFGGFDFEQRDEPGPSNGDFSMQYLSIAGAYAYDFKWFSAGAAFQYLNEDIYPDKATGYAVNAGLARSFLDERLRIGASILNLGEMSKLNETSTDLPTTLKAGVAVDVFEFNPPKNKNLPILVSLYADYVHPYETIKNSDFTDYDQESDYLNFAISFNIANVIEISSGYKTGDTERPITFGAGFFTQKLSFNYALIPFNTGFGTVHSIGIQYQL